MPALGMTAKGVVLRTVQLNQKRETAVNSASRL
jgi:hypothetical protein